ncbi:MAG TPA: sigma-54 dependent transcriptional regulator [Pseudomonadales bacterium]|nr:sigma-54 dependent transcriptional regulator [Pseudomonadales bacterium]
MANVLIVDDETAFTGGMGQVLRHLGHAVSCAETLADARRHFAARKPDLLLLDLMLPDGSGLELLEEVKDAPPDRIVIVTGHPGVKSFIQGVAGPGVSFLTKPVEAKDIVGLLRSTDDADGDGAPRAEKHYGVLIGESEPMQALYTKVRQVAPMETSVLIQGESGTGKELLAEAIHVASGRKGAYIPVNCGGFSKELLSSELFGHERGSFTGANRRHSGVFERAHGGTLFLDEITEMPLEMQPYFLRVLETNRVLRVGAEEEVPVDVRVIAATNRDPWEAVQAKKLREDLYFRLRVVPFEMPPLRARRDDVRLLAESFLDGLNQQNNTQKRFAPETLERFTAYEWPGNVRELKHAVHHGYVIVDAADGVVLPPERFDAPWNEQASEGLKAGRSIREVEKDLIYMTLEHCKGDKRSAAAMLGVSLKTLYNRLNEYAAEQSQP